MLAYKLLFLEMETFPLGREGKLLASYLMAVTVDAESLREALTAIIDNDTSLYPRLLARASAGGG